MVNRQVPFSADNIDPLAFGARFKHGNKQQYEEITREYRATVSSSEDPSVCTCYVLSLHFDLSSPAAAVADGTQHTGDLFPR